MSQRSRKYFLIHFNDSIFILTECCWSSKRFDCFKGSGFEEWVAFCFVVGLKVMGQYAEMSLNSLEYHLSVTWPFLSESLSLQWYAMIWQISWQTNWTVTRQWDTRLGSACGRSSAGAGVLLGNLEALKGDPGEGYLTSFTCLFKIKWPLVVFVLWQLLLFFGKEEVLQTCLRYCWIILMYIFELL